MNPIMCYKIKGGLVILIKTSLVEDDRLNTDVNKQSLSFWTGVLKVDVFHCSKRNPSLIHIKPHPDQHRSLKNRPLSGI